MGQLLLCGIRNHREDEAIYEEVYEKHCHDCQWVSNDKLARRPRLQTNYANYNNIKNRQKNYRRKNTFPVQETSKSTIIEYPKSEVAPEDQVPPRRYNGPYCTVELPALRTVSSSQTVEQTVDLNCGRLSERDNRQCTEVLGVGVGPPIEHVEARQSASQYSRLFSFKQDAVVPVTVKAGDSASQGYSQLFTAPALKQDTPPETPYEDVEVTRDSQQVSVQSSNLSVLHQTPVMDDNSLKNLPDDGIKCPLSNVTIISSVCDHTGGILNTKDGIKLTIPKDAIKEGDLVNICTATDLYGPFVLPTKRLTGLVSPYYWIGIARSYRFQKPVKVELEHFAVVTACDPSHYQLLTCEDDDESYTMRPVDYELDFEVQGNISLCTFHTQQFCSYCLFHKCEDMVINRIGAFYLKPENFQCLNYFTVEIWFSFISSYCLKRNKELYTKNGKVLDTNCSCIFEVSSDKSSTSCFTLDYEKSFDGWSVDHFRYTKIQTKDVNFYNYYTNIEQLKETEESCLFPPRFVLKVTKKSKCDKSLDTNIIVALCKQEDKRSMNSDCVPFNLFVPISATTKDPTYTNVLKDDSLVTLQHNASYICMTSPYSPGYCYQEPKQKHFEYVYGRPYHKPESADSLTYDYPYHNRKPPVSQGKNPLHSINDHQCHNNKPELVDLTKYSTKISLQWEQIALKLNISADYISTINLDHQYTEKKCLAMFNKWLNITIDPCWCHFILALYHVGLDGIAEEAKQHINISTYKNVSFTPSDVDESNLNDDLVDFHELVRFLKDIPESNTNYFISRLLHKENAIYVIKDIRRNGGNREDNTKKICKAFLEEEDPSWSKVCRALKEAECDDVADIVEACFLPM